MKLTWYESMGRLTLDMTLEQAESVSHQGQCYNDVIELMKVPAIAKQLNAMKDADIVASLREVGAWEPSEMLDRQTNLERIVWLAGCDLKEEARSNE